MSAPVALPPTGLPPPVPAAPAAGPSVTVLGGAAPALAALAGGALLSGMVAAEEAGGARLLLTTLGSLTIAGTTPLPAGMRLVLQATPAQPGTAIVITLDAGPTVAPPSPSTILTLGSTIAATVVVAADPTGNGSPPALTGMPAAVTPIPGGKPVAGSDRGAAAVSAAPSSAGPATAPLPEASTATAAPLAASRLLANRGTGPAPLLPGLPPSPAAATLPSGADGPLATPLPSRPPAAGGPINSRPGAQPADPAALPPDGAASAASSPWQPGARLVLRVLATQPAQLDATSPAAAAPALVGTVRPTPLGAPATPQAGTLVIDTPTGPLALIGAPPVSPGSRLALALLPGAPATARLTVLGDAPSPASSSHPAAAPAAGPVDPPGPATPEPVGGPPADASFPALLAMPEEVAGQLLVVGTVIPDVAAPPGPAAGQTPLLLQTPLGLLALAPRPALPPGSLLLLLPQALPPAARPEPASPGAAKTSWTGLAAALGELERVAPVVAAQLAADLSPAAGGDRLAASFLFLIGALRDGTSRWPGAAVEDALGGRTDLHLALAADVTAAHALATDPATGPWQVLILPLVEGSVVQPIRLYLRRHDKGAAGTDAEKSARFILEFELSRLGALQLDGLVRPRRFDLVLRTQQPLGGTVTGMVERIFRDRIAAAGIAGTIDFADPGRFEVAPLDALRRPVGLAV